MSKYGGNKISASGVSPKRVKSRRAKVNDYNGQYLSPEPRFEGKKKNLRDLSRTIKSDLSILELEFKI